MKKILGVFIMFLAINLLIVSCTNNEEANTSFKEQTTEDALSFKKEYEELNSVKDDNGKLKYQNLKIDDDNLVVYVSYEEVLELIDNGTGVIYLGRPACPWSRNLIDTILDFSWYNDENIYYLNIEEMRKENTEEYKNLTDILDEYLPVDTITQKENSKKFDKNLKRITLPFVFFVKNGEVKDYYSGFEEINLKNNNYSEIEKKFNESYDLIK